MAHIWEQTIIIDKPLARQLIEQQSGLNVSSLELFGEGFDNVAYLVNKKWVFRFPRREMGAECIENEINLLPYIHHRVSFPFSYPQWIGKASEIYPASFAGYPMIPGKPLCDTDPLLISDVTFAQTLAHWLKELHTVPVRAEHHEMLKGDQSWRYDMHGKLDKTKERIMHYQSYFVDAGFDIDELLAPIERLRTLNYGNSNQVSYTHGDLYSRHLIVDDTKNLQGIIDWGDIHIGNPGTDLSIGYMIFSDVALQTFFDTYGPVSDETKNVAIMRVFCHSIILLAYCYDKKEEALKQWTILALKNVLRKIHP